MINIYLIAIVCDYQTSMRIWMFAFVKPALSTVASGFIRLIGG